MVYTSKTVNINTINQINTTNYNGSVVPDIVSFLAKQFATGRIKPTTTTIHHLLEPFCILLHFRFFPFHLALYSVDLKRVTMHLSSFVYLLSFRFNSNTESRSLRSELNHHTRARRKKNFAHCKATLRHFGSGVAVSPGSFIMYATKCTAAFAAREIKSKYRNDGTPVGLHGTGSSVKPVHCEKANISSIFIFSLSSTIAWLLLVG